MTKQYTCRWPLMASIKLLNNIKKKSGSDSSETTSSTTVSNSNSSRAVCIILYTSSGLIPISIATAIVAAAPAWIILNHVKNQQKKKSKDGLSGSTVNEVVCEICLENKEIRQMFANDTCSHTFCSDCITSYTISKIQDRVDQVTCPALNCGARLNPDTCKLLIPKSSRDQWDELMCLALFPESKRVYCPYLDCLAILINDSRTTIMDAKCVACKRDFCAQCHVPWQMEFTCEEFQKYTKDQGGDDEIMKELAKKKKWQRCPECKIYVAKTAGCRHIVCRCGFDFCYDCGSRWNSGNGHDWCST